MKATHEHDCEECTLLAANITLRGETFDFYVCGSGDPRFDSLIARFGSKGEQYRSWHPSDMIMDPVGGLMQGLWAQHHKVRGAGPGFVVLGNGETIAFTGARTR